MRTADARRRDHFGNPLDGDCSATTKVAYFYRANSGCPGGAAACFKPLADPTAPRPADLVNTTTKDGVAVPYIVRLEAGTINRGIYHIAIFDNPAVGALLPAHFTPGTGWNCKLIVYFDGGGSASFKQGPVPFDASANSPVWGEFALSRGLRLRGRASRSTRRCWSARSAPRRSRWSGSRAALLAPKMIVFD